MIMKKTTYDEYIYNYIKEECGDLDCIYEDFIIRLVGELGLLSLKKNQHIETCGVINGRQLYVLC